MTITPDYDPGKHRYSVLGAEIPGVTRILSDLDLAGSPWYKEEHRIRGSRVHALCLEIATLEKEGEWEWDGTCQWPGIAEYGRGFLEWLRKGKYRVLDTEKIIYHPVLIYAGRYDLTLLDPNDKIVLVDIKSGRPEPSVKVQLAAYGLCEAHDQRLSLWLKKDGKYKSEDHTSPEADHIWMSVLNTWKYKKHIGRMKK